MDYVTKETYEDILFDRYCQCLLEENERPVTCECPACGWSLIENGDYSGVECRRCGFEVVYRSTVKEDRE